MSGFSMTVWKSQHLYREYYSCGMGMVLEKGARDGNLI